MATVETIIADICRAREELPPVRVRFNGREHWGRVTGRLEDFATVTITADPAKRLGSGAPWMDFPFSWSAVARAAYRGRVLHAD